MNVTGHTRTNRAALALLLAIAALTALAVTTGCTTKVITAPAGAAANTVTASGSGKVAATPDEATMNFGVSARATDADDALAAASKTAEKITAAVLGAGVAKKDIQTSSVSLYPQSDASGKITGYEAGLSLTVKVRDLGTIGEVIAAANAAGANNISGPAFGIADDAKYRAAAIDKAVADARTSAEAMAKAAGGKIGDVISVTRSNVNVPPPVHAGALGDKSAGMESVPVEVGQLDVTADLTVVFELK
jgi:uncharacterized protein